VDLIIYKWRDAGIEIRVDVPPSRDLCEAMEHADAKLVEFGIAWQSWHDEVEVDWIMVEER
jgi:hypothetical protein